MVKINEAIIQGAKSDADEETIYFTFKELFEYKDLYKAMTQEINLYGEGHTSEKITDIIADI